METLSVIPELYMQKYVGIDVANQVAAICD
jgi:hypothetical protein